MQRNETVKKLKINGANLKVGLVVSQFNRDIAEAMARGAVAELKKHGVKPGNIKIVRVPGSVEIPLGCQLLAKTHEFDGLVAVGAVIKGETPHDVYVATMASQGILRVSLDFSIPIGFGVITVSDIKQAKARAAGKNNKGAEAARAMLMMITVKKES